MADRKAELERKKARLEQMRRERKEKELSKKGKEGDESSGTIKAGAGDTTGTEPDDILKEFGIAPTPEAATGSPAKVVPQRQETEVPASVSHTTPRKVRLSVAKVSETTIAPRENVSYSKETQTIAAEPVDKDDHSFSESSSSWHGSPRSSSYGHRIAFHDLEWDDEFFDDEVLVYDDGNRSDEDNDLDFMETEGSGSHPHRHGHAHGHGHGHHHKMPHVEMVAAATTQDDVPKEAPKPPRELSEEEKKQILMSEDFNKFFDYASRIMERALAEDVDVFADYSGHSGASKDDEAMAGERLKLNRDFYDDKWTKHRIVTSLDWSSQHPELLLASYSANEDATNVPDGVALIWNIKYRKDTPEYIFHCQSPVMSSCFARFHPNLVLGGTYSGQIVLWDNRVNKRTPVQRTPLSASAHTHPVYCVTVVGTQNAHNLISVSNDGKLCSWSLDMLSQPQDSMELQHKQSKSVAATCFSFLAGDANNFIVGSEECLVYSASRHGSKAGINEAYEGHQGPITAIDTHRAAGQIDFSPYFLTASFDWTVKLWSMKEQKYLCSFEDNSDYVSDVQWSPTNPALFSSVDIMGRLDLWHLNHETEVPTASVVVDANVALNKCRWHQTGHHIGVADDMGRIYIYDVGEHIANPTGDEWSKFVQTLQEMKQQAAEREEDSCLLGSAAPIR
ncbi:cytoplasmic dynein 1 intermediate chain 2-like isoform X6 [Babylonia areolata]|uniref:cytoplasmic dynein 1 intermediate chain 2-like isoform X6 n=1 Tax=Babylonia areolata TaxID=304850 RepID=UPI003FD17D73